MSVLVLLPTYNERDNLPRLVPRILEHDGYRVLIIDDSSPDGTGDAADAMHRELPSRVSVLHRVRKDGLGRACVAGMRRALGEDPKHIIQMDADGSHNPADLPRLVAAAAHNDLVLGSRYVKGGGIENWPRHRLALSTTANRYVRLVTGIDVRDCTAGFRCWRPALLRRLGIETLRSNGYGFQIETLYRALKLGASVCEVPIVFTDRIEGRSKMSGRIMFEAALLPWRLRVRLGSLPPARITRTDSNFDGAELDARHTIQQ